jgi:hypothetical protein
VWVFIIIIIQNVGEFEKTGNDIFHNVNLVLKCLSINCLLDSTMAAKKFRPSFFRHFKKIGVVHSLLSL